MKALIILGSARSDGNTAAAARHLLGQLGDDAELFDLLRYRITPYSYAPQPEADDFPVIAQRMLAHPHIVFATPVYWYAMSGGLKTFFDRLTDLIRGPAKHRGEALAGRTVWLLAAGTDRELPPGFTEPFVRTAAYLGMSWGRAAYVRTGRHAPDPLAELAEVDRLAARLRSTSGG
jgi:putative NADPH-quinone reductase